MRTVSARLASRFTRRLHERVQEGSELGGQGDRHLVHLIRHAFIETPIEPEDIWVLARTEASSLTLVTCYPFSYISHAQVGGSRGGGGHHGELAEEMWD